LGEARPWLRSLLGQAGSASVTPTSLLIGRVPDQAGDHDANDDNVAEDKFNEALRKLSDIGYDGGEDGEDTLEGAEEGIEEGGEDVEDGLDKVLDGR